MKKIKHFFLLTISIIAVALQAQSQQVDSIRFFTDEQALEMTLTTDIKGLQSQKGDDIFQEGSATIKFPDNTTITETVNVGARGKFRRGYCRIPPIMINFRDKGASKLASLGKLKLVIGCGARTDDEQLLLKEFLIYKIYNLLENKSFRVRLVKTNYVDSKNRVKAFSQYSFFIEDDGDMARRNGCKKKDHPPYQTESTNRALMTKVAIFEYLIGNTDWSVPNLHNIKLIFEKKDDVSLPYAVPYDFDYCGLVDASYAVPNEVIGTEKITERVYRGFPRTMEELKITLAVFKDKKEAIYSLINGFTLITERNRKIMIDYLDDFYQTINSDSMVRSIFIDKARTN